MAQEGEPPKSETAEDPASAAQTDPGKGGSGPMAIFFPPDLPVWLEARRLVADKNIRVEDLATCATQDPVIVIELLRTSNAMFFAGGRSPITSTRTAIVRLGSDIVLETLEKMSERAPIDHEDVSHWFEMHRGRCKRTAIVAKILSEAVARNLSDDCQTIGLLWHVGEMLAVAHFREKYVELAEQLSRSGINYRLSQDEKFDVERMGITYLRRNGIPEALLFALDRDGRSRTPDRAIMKPICMASCEMVDAFDANRWEKIAPGKTLPPKSALRMLQLPETQYLKVYERTSEYLFAARLVEEKKKQDILESVTSAAVATMDAQKKSSEEAALQSEILGILDEAAGEFEDEDNFEKAKPPDIAKPTKIITTKESIADRYDQFNLKPKDAKPKNVARVQRPEPAKPTAPINSTSGTKVVSSITNMFDQAQNAEDLLTSLLKMLVDNGPFEKSALIVVSKDRKSAIVVAARGPNIGNGQKLALTDPLSPLVSCLSKVQSFGNKESECSPFGSKSFAVAPVDADHDTPVALYADCGNNGSISFEARRVFRTVVEILNHKLPSLPGGIPVEI